MKKPMKKMTEREIRLEGYRLLMESGYPLSAWVYWFMSWKPNA